MQGETIPDQQPVSTPPQQPSGDSFPPGEEPIQEKKPNQWLIIGLVVLALIALGAAGFFAYRYFQLKQQPSVSLPAPSNRITTTPSPVISPEPTIDPTADWQVYVNEKHNFKLSYPQEYSLKEVNPDYILIKKKEAPEHNWLISIDIEKDIKGETDSLSFHDFAVNRALAFCAADGPMGSHYCDKVIKEREVTNQYGLQGFIFDLNLVKETFGESPSKASTVKEPVYAIDISEETNARGIFFEFSDQSEPSLPEDKQTLQRILSTFKFTN